VPRFYDTLISKLIAWGEDRPTTLARMRRALGEYVVLGVRTTLPVLSRIIDHDDFRAGRLSTQFLERVLPELAKPHRELEPVAVVAAVLAEYERLRQPAAAADSTAPGVSGWRIGARPGWQGGRPR
jgi:acetyl/propionyl-CoA carboxylase alpha subunit